MNVNYFCFVVFFVLNNAQPPPHSFGVFIIPDRKSQAPLMPCTPPAALSTCQMRIVPSSDPLATLLPPGENRTQ